MSLRIAGGHGRGRALHVPAGDTRPTSERARAGLFNRLDTLLELDGATVLDLFAGSGAVGLEAVSRGAGAAALVDSDRRAADAIRANLRTLADVADRVTVSVRSVAAFLDAGPAGVVGAPFDVVFADPPYALAEADVAAVLGAVVRPSWTSTGAVVVVERSRRSPEPGWPDRVVALSPKRYGEATLWYGRAQ